MRPARLIAARARRTVAPTLLTALAVTGGCERESEPAPTPYEIILNDDDPPPRYAAIPTVRGDETEPRSIAPAPAPAAGPPGLEDPEFVADYPSAACETGEDCLRKGYENFKVGEADEDRKLAYVYFHLGCLQNHAPSCHEQAEMFPMLALGSYPKTEWAAAWRLHLYAKACDGGYGIACISLGDRLEGSERLEAHARANPLLRAGCDAGRVDDCVWLASNLNTGRGGERDEAKAAELFKAACLTKDAYACESYAVALQDGEGVAKDWAASRKWLKKACKLEPKHCGQLTGVIRKRRDD